MVHASLQFIVKLEREFHLYHQYLLHAPLHALLYCFKKKKEKRAPKT